MDGVLVLFDTENVFAPNVSPTLRCFSSSGSTQALVILPTLPPGPPTNLQVTGQTTTTLSISWTNPTFNGFSDIASFRVQVTERGSTFPYTFNGDEDTTTFTLTGLLPFTNYTVRLFVRNAVGLEGQPAETIGMTDSLRKS